MARIRPTCKPKPSPGKIALQTIGLALTIGAAIYVTKTLNKSLSQVSASEKDS